MTLTRLIFMTLVVLTTLPSRGQAQGFEVSPIPVEAQGGRTTVRVRNPTASPSYIEASVMDWGRDGAGAEVLRESTAVVVSPPGFWVPAGGNQLLRLSLPQAPQGQEVAYRLVLQQIPDRGALAAGRVVIAVRQLIPVFASGDNLAPPQLSASLTPGGILVQNSGGRRLRISRITQDNRVLAGGLLGYALGGTRTRLQVPGLRPGRVEIETDLGVRIVDLR